MREIKFRGQRLDKSGMVEGDLIHGVGSKSGRMFILPIVHNLASVKGCDPLDGVEVIPETAGMLTGLKDKNGKEIYKGDIASWMDDNEIHYGEFFWDEDAYGFRIQMKKGYMPSYKLLPKHIEVIGNIYENPELLEEDQ